MELSDWATGPPPMIGWWNASKERDPSARRWWDGERFSAPVYVGDPDEHAIRAQSTPAEDQGGIEWRGCLLASLTEDEVDAITEAQDAEFDALQRSPNTRESAALGLRLAQRGLLRVHQKRLLLIAEVERETGNEPR